MSCSELEADTRLSAVEREWQAAFAASARARSRYHAMAADPAADLAEIDHARELYERCQAVKNHVLDKLDLLGHGLTIL